MKKFIYILTVVSLVLALVAIPTFAEQDCNSSFHVLNITNINEKNQAVTIYAHDTYGINPKRYLIFNGYDVKQYFHVTPLIESGQMQLLRLKDATLNPSNIDNYDVVYRKLFSNFGMTYDFTPSSFYFDDITAMRIRVVDSDGNTVPFICTYLKGDYSTGFTYVANQDTYLKELATSFTCSMKTGLSYETGFQAGYEQAVEDAKATLPEVITYEACGTYTVYLNEGDSCKIVFESDLQEPWFGIDYNSSWFGGLGGEEKFPLMASGCSYDMTATSAGNYTFKFLGANNSKGQFRIHRFPSVNISPEYSAGYDLGYSEGYSKGVENGKNENTGSGSYEDGYNDGYNPGYSDGYDYGYNDGYNQAIKDNSSDGKYVDGFADGEANILNQMREYMIAQGLSPQGNSVEALLSYYASALNSNSNNDNDVWRDGYNEGYYEGQIKGSVYGYEQARVEFENKYTIMLEEKYDEGYLSGYNVGFLKGQNMHFDDSYNQAFDKLKENIENSTNEIKNSIDVEANGSFIQGFLAGMWNGMTGFISMILSGITFSGLSLMHIFSTAIAILTAAFVIKMLRS